MKCALVGNQNSGKSLLFNDLTGLNQKVGNWAGVTIERKEGIIKGTDIEIVDLPGIYSLSPYTSEEEVSRKFIIEEKPDLIINIIDSTSIERSLYLTTQLLELGIDVVIVLNMEDILKKRGYKLDIKQLENYLHTSCYSISALKNTGIKELVNAIKNKEYKENSNLNIFNSDIEEYIKRVDLCLPSEIKERRFSAIKLLENDIRYNSLKEQLKKLIDIDNEIKVIEKNNNDDTEELIASQRYKFIESIRDSVITKSKKKSISEKIDKVILNKYASIPVFILIMIIIFTLSVGIIGGLTVNLVDTFFNGCDGGIPIEMFGIQIGTIPSTFKGIGPMLGEVISNNNGSDWAVSLIADGIIGGVGAVVNFIPQLVILFLLLSLLETSGYMSRITFLFDNFFRKIGLSGKSLIPFIVGIGCSVPAIMSSRTVEDDKEKKMTITLTPFIPCNAKLPIIACICGGFFGQYSLLVTILMYFFAIAVIILVGWFMNKFIIKNKSTSYLIELPEYHIPSARYVFKDTFEKTLEFLKRAGTIILLASIVVWFLGSFTYDFHYVDGTNHFIEQSFLAYIGRGLSWIFYPMVGIGHNYNDIWGISVSAIQGLVAKEQVISSMQVIAKVADEGNIFTSSAFSYLNPVTAFAIMTFNLFSAPCFGAIGAMKKELGSYKEMFKAIGIETGFAWVIASLIGIVGGILGLLGVF
ncbi:MAG: ferrous iron transport protein B [Candidatus Onthovivens sp.]|nr:ferrous iron transport protein B [Candidatus Onthovivens sp.]